MTGRGSPRKTVFGSPQPSDSSPAIRTIYRELSRAWGPQHWWPAETPFEVIVGAILTQNTSWANVEHALAKLRVAGVLSLKGVRDLAVGELEQLVRSSGYFRQKAARLKDFVALVDRRYGGSLDAMLARPTVDLREELLTQKGIGPETADSILLYAGQHPIFVVDAYTRRVLERHEAITQAAKYDQIRELVERSLGQEEPTANSAGIGERHARAPRAHSPSAMSMAARPALAQLYNEMHGLFVQLGKHYCTKSNPKCETCPVSTVLPPPRLVELPISKRVSTPQRRRKSAKARL